MFITRYEMYFTSFISYILIIYKCFYLIFHFYFMINVYLFTDFF